MEEFKCMLWIDYLFNFNFLLKTFCFLPKLINNRLVAAKYSGNIYLVIIEKIKKKPQTSNGCIFQDVDDRLEYDSVTVNGVSTNNNNGQETFFSFFSPFFWGGGG